MNNREKDYTAHGNETVSLSRSRFLIVKLIFAVFFASILFRLVKIQVIDAGKYKDLARKQYERSFVLPATRGNIFDRNGNVIVSNTILLSFAADPKIVGDRKHQVAQVFGHVFGKPSSFYLEKMRETDEDQNIKRFVWLERRVTPEIARRIEAAKLEGIVTINEPKTIISLR